MNFCFNELEGLRKKVRYSEVSYKGRVSTIKCISEKTGPEEKSIMSGGPFYRSDPEFDCIIDFLIDPLEVHHN